MAVIIEDVLERSAQALEAACALQEAARQAVGALLVHEGALDQRLLERHQFAAHGFAWLATYVEALRQMLAWAVALRASGDLGELEQLILQAAFGEYLNQMFCGISLSQREIVRPLDLGMDDEACRQLQNPAAAVFRCRGNTAAVRERIARLIGESRAFGAMGLADESLELIQAQFRRFTEEQVVPFAHRWHLEDRLIPLPVIEAMARLGVFGLTVDEVHGGIGLGKSAMCVVTEELSRGYIGVGSLGTRSEIAAELIRLGGTEQQKQHFLPKIASGEILPTAVFTEPNTGSDLGSLRTLAVREGEYFRIIGNKTWITHAARSDLMTLLVRTDPKSTDWRGLSMLLAEKPRGTEQQPFPAPGMSGTEISVLGYRGMKEYELSFDGFMVPTANLLGGTLGQGFKQLMATFESARVQTAARAVGVAQAAMELGLRYALERQQFGKLIHAFPRVSGKIAWMAVETMVARQLTLFAARRKDSGERCDTEAGMAKLLAARVAWANADEALQIHGGNGYALEFPISRVLCDARILNVFEGAAEIQAHIIARSLLAPRN